MNVDSRKFFFAYYAFLFYYILKRRGWFLFITIIKTIPKIYTEKGEHYGITISN